MVFFSFQVKFLRAEEEYSILCASCSLQQQILLAFCNDFDTHYRMFAYILLRNKILLFPKWRQKPACAILRCSSVVNMEDGNFTNSYKILMKMATTLFFSQWWSRELHRVLSPGRGGEVVLQDGVWLHENTRETNIFTFLLKSPGIISEFLCSNSFIRESTRP